MPLNLVQTRQQRAALLIALLGVAIAIAMSSFAIGLLGAAVLYVLCAPAYSRLRRWFAPSAAASITLAGAILLVAVPVMWIVAMVANEAPGIIRGAQDSGLFGKLAGLRIGRLDVGAEIAKASGTFLQWLSQQAFDFVGNAARATLNLVISFFALFYMLVSADRTWAAFRELLPFSQESAEELRASFYSVTHATILGTAVTSVAQGTLVGVGFALVGISSPLFWGVVTGFASILPVLGSALVWFPGVLYLVGQERFGGAITLGVIGLVLASNVDNVLRPLIYRRVSNIHPLVTLLGAFAGVKYFGLLGVLLGPLAIQYFFEFVRLYKREYGLTATPVSESVAAGGTGAGEASAPVG